jgi:hypothetical protein
MWIDLAWNAGVAGLDAPGGPGRVRRSWVWCGGCKRRIRSAVNDSIGIESKG